MNYTTFLLVLPAALIACNGSIDAELQPDADARDSQMEGDADETPTSGTDDDMPTVSAWTDHHVSFDLPDDGDDGGHPDMSMHREIDTIAVDAGGFVMGAQVGEDDVHQLDEWPHEVELTGEFYIAETEVTQNQFLAYMGYDPTASSVMVCSGDCPVHLVSWHEAAAFSNAMSAHHDLEDCYDCEGDGPDVSCTLTMDPYECEGYRLPTEAEWEYAARAGEETVYPGSDDVGVVGWFQGNAGMALWPVALLEPNAWGLYDMGGNIREFVNDWHVPQTSAAVVDPYVGMDEGAFPVEKGGSFACIPEHLEPNTRYMHMNSGDALTDYMRDVHVGFRVARSIR